MFLEACLSFLRHGCLRSRGLQEAGFRSRDTYAALVRWQRRSRLPDDVKKSLELEPGEQVLVWAQDESGEWLVATDAALLVSGRRLSWVLVERAGWDDETWTLSVEMMRPENDEPERLRWVVLEPGRLPETVRERVDASIVASRRVRVRGSQGLRVVARSARSSAELVWQVLLDPGLDASAPLVQAASEQAVEELRRELEG